MKRNLISYIIPLSFFLLSSITSAEPETYTLDPNHTYVEWHINHLGFSNPSGKWMAEGTLILDQAKPQNVNSMQLFIQPIS